MLKNITAGQRHNLNRIGVVESGLTCAICSEFRCMDQKYMRALLVLHFSVLLV